MELKSRKHLVLPALLVALLTWTLEPFLLQAEVVGIRTYQATASQMVGTVITCRYEQTCSHFGLSELQESGFWRGNARLAVRLLSCSPLGMLLEQAGIETYPLRQTVKFEVRSSN